MSDPDSFRALLGHRSYVYFWLTRLSSQLAGQMMMVALGWQMYDLTSSAWDLGLVGLAQFLPALLLTLPAGHVADRYHRARVMLGATALQALAAAGLTWASHGGWASRELILLVSIGLGVAKAFQMPASQALPALLVPMGLLPRAVALSSSGMQLAIIGGPAIGGLLYVAGADVVYLLCAALLLLGCALAAGIRHEAPAAAQARSWRTVFDGVHFLRGQPVMLGAISLDLFAVLLGGATALLPIFAKDILHTGPWGLGLLRAAPAVGALLMSAWLARRPLERRVGHWMLSAVGVFGLCMLVFALSTSLWLSMVALLVSGAADMVSVVIRQTLVQLETPDEMRGRVSAVNSIFIGASNQLGEFESGTTAALMGPVGSVLLGGVGVLAVTLAWTRLFPGLWQRDRLHPQREPS
ncbi:putative MFS family arabinose efflux permease [Sphaerotilus hippei]|uniref:Putative MFS family arabinose efflux permease n=1 Tax=Sphaerotilus hippei TaxID=744406 RepID=A0A318GVN4_9BURK|nr:MFS transporter [Sphaerotilus hippei]PXW92879.1 putative MFS family arabinose efflux permease [Sphaerotilus hippei]